ncbi:MAG: hypothetical protein WCV81_04610 [Microgenomates group bacterium]|jgi:hypothetical protein
MERQKADFIYKIGLDVAIFFGRVGLTETLINKLNLSPEDKNRSLTAAYFSAASRCEIIWGDHEKARQYSDIALSYTPLISQKRHP